MKKIYTVDLYPGITKEILIAEIYQLDGERVSEISDEHLDRLGFFRRTASAYNTREEAEQVADYVRRHEVNYVHVGEVRFNAHLEQLEHGHKVYCVKIQGHDSICVAIASTYELPPNDQPRATVRMIKEGDRQVPHLSWVGWASSADDANYEAQKLTKFEYDGVDETGAHKAWNDTWVQCIKIGVIEQSQG